MPDPRPPILLTRPAVPALRFAALLNERFPDVHVELSPILQIVHRPIGLNLAGLAGVVLTSENGAAALVGQPGVAGLRAYCVGDRTAETAREAGLDAVSAQGAADDLVALIQAEAPQGPLLFARGAESRGAVAERLTDAGLLVESYVVYDQVPEPLTDAALALVNGASPVVAPVFSVRSADLLGRAWGGAPVVLVALSAAVAGAWSGPPPTRRLIAALPTGAALCAALEKYYSETIA